MRRFTCDICGKVMTEQLIEYPMNLPEGFKCENRKAITAIFSVNDKPRLREDYCQECTWILGKFINRLKEVKKR